MRNRKSQRGSEQPSLQPLLGLAAVRSVNPSLQGEGGEERVTSMANSLQVNGDVRMENQGEGSEELTGRAMPSAIAIGELPGASILHPMLIEESESDSELPSSIHPSKAPEDSLLHTLYLQLVGAGRDGITVRELFKCLQQPAEVHRFESDWKVQVRRHLKTNPHFCEAKGYHYFVCNDELEVQQPQRSPANIASTSRRYGASSSQTVLSSQHSTPATLQPGLSVNTHEGIPEVDDRPRRKAFLKATAALSEQATEFEEMHQSTGDMQMPSSVADPTDSQLVSRGPLSKPSRKRKPPSSDEEELPHHDHPIPGGLQATQAEIFPKTEVQTGQPCVVQRDDTGNGLSSMEAMIVDTLRNLPRYIGLQKDGKSSLSPNPGSPKYLTASEPWITQDEGVQTGVQCGHGHKSKDGITSSRISPPSDAEVAKNVDKRATAVSSYDDDSIGEQLQQEIPKGVPKRHHVAARKTAANVGPLKSQGLIRPPTTPPLPPPYGIRRKAPVKHRDQ